MTTEERIDALEKALETSVRIRSSVSLVDKDLCGLSW
jgi:hypothetical protein